ncbi:MAG: hypothetical protein OXU20_23450 [Myxococcales bacterium]|nr:hypothetical protein [Myxococcales bacterium]
MGPAQRFTRRWVGAAPLVTPARLVAPALLVLAQACATAPDAREEATPRTSPKQAPADAEASAETATEPSPQTPAQPSPGGKPTASADGMPPPLPQRVDAGTIPRATLVQVLSAGIPRFLQRVPVERFPDSGRFLGWRLLSLFEDQPEIAQQSVVQPGDVIVRVNRHSIERPEQFASVWQSLAGGSEIVFDILRGDQPSSVRYLISDDNLGTAPLP